MPRLIPPFLILLLVTCSPLRANPYVFNVWDAASFGWNLAPNEWITIVGSHMADSERAWQSSDLVNGALPTQLGGVQVLIGGRPAVISYVSPDQINALIPSDMVIGSQSVQVISNGVAADPVTVTIGDYGPSMFRWQDGYPVATHLNYKPALPANIYPSLGSTPAVPGETIIFWMTGLGATNPPVPPGQLTTQTGYVQAPITFRFRDPAGTPHDVTALSAAASQGYAGLYQAAVRIPDTFSAATYRVSVLMGDVESLTGPFVIGSPSGGGTSPPKM